MNTNTNTKITTTSADLLEGLNEEFADAAAVTCDGWTECAAFVRANTWAFDDDDEVVITFGPVPEGWGDPDRCECDSCTQVRADREYADGAA